MSDKWQAIWSKKDITFTDEIKLENLIKANGFDTGVGSYTLENWKWMVADFCRRVGLKSSDTVMEIGCGSGAFIFAANEIYKSNWFGIDYSENLINIATKAIPKSHFVADEAINQNFKFTTFDVIFSHSVFQYFPSVDYAEIVLKNWCSKINKNGFLVLLDINDSEYEKNYHLDRAKEYKSPGEYEKAYKDLSHLFFDKKKLGEFLETIGMTNIEFFPHAVADYGNSKFRFNLICHQL